MTYLSRLALATLLPVVLVGCGPDASVCLAPPDPGGGPGQAGSALRFCGTGADDIDRIKVPVDDPRTDVGTLPVDVGATDFTIEWWMKATLDGNRQGEIRCGPGNINWINGNILIDRDRFNQGRKFGVSLGAGRIVFGATGDADDHRTICGTTNVADGRWHHVAVQRRRADGEMSLFVDGHLEARALGPAGDLSYPDDGVPLDFCDGPCLDSDPFLVIGAEKHDAGPDWPPYSGWLDEMRISTVLRYEADFDSPSTPFEPDAATVALWHFDEGGGEVLTDSSNNGSDGLLRIGGPYEAPQWGASDAPLR